MNTIISLLIIFGGIFFFILDTMMFEMKESNVKWILMCIGAFVPLVGLVIYGLLFFYCIAYYEKDAVSYRYKNANSNIYIKDTKLNRWLFNDVEWSLIDSMKNEGKIQNK
jgi:Trk-type K+ transport system membrane component